MMIGLNFSVLLVGYIMFIARVDAYGDYTMKAYHACGGDVPSDTRIIKFPEFGKYDNKLYCRWNIKREGEFNLKFKSFHVERQFGHCNFDYLIVGSNGEKLCGSTPPPTINVKDGQIQLLFVSDSSENEDGFEIEIVPVNRNDACYVCSCSGDYYFEGGVIVDCAARQLTEVPENFPDQTTQLYLHYNLLTHIDNSDIDNLTELRLLYLNLNKLKSLPPSLFNSLTRLTYLYLNDNVLTSLPKTIFDSLTELTHLFLQNNQLESLPPNVFDSVTRLTSLNLDSNKLTSLPDQIFQKQSQLIYVSFTNNPLQCTCNLYDILIEVTGQDRRYINKLGVCTGHPVCDYTDCGGDVPVNTKVIKFPKSGKYKRNLDCIWTFDFGKEFNLRFKRFSTEYHIYCNYDYLKIGNKKVCGNTIPDVTNVKDGKIQLVFHSDDLENEDGFEIEIVPVNR